MTNVDLHTHSTYSDGLLTPEALCVLAVRKHIRWLALCDHDTTDGLPAMTEAASAQQASGMDITLIPALELSAGPDGRTHVLGYGAGVMAAPLTEALQALRRQRLTRGAQMVEALRGIGVQIPPEMIPTPGSEGMALGRPHIARALMGMGLVHSVEQAFNRYLGEGRPAYVPLDHFSAVEAVTLLKRCGAVPVLAHPARLHMPPQVLEALVESLAAVGLMGLEVYHPSASRGDVRMLLGMAQRRKLLVTGGSDFHGDKGARARLGGVPPGWRDPTADTQALLTAIAAPREAAN